MLLDLRNNSSRVDSVMELEGVESCWDLLVWCLSRLQHNDFPRRISIYDTQHPIITRGYEYTDE